MMGDREVEHMRQQMKGCPGGSRWQRMALWHGRGAAARLQARRQAAVTVEEQPQHKQADKRQGRVGRDATDRSFAHTCIRRSSSAHKSLCARAAVRR